MNDIRFRSAANASIRGGKRIALGALVIFERKFRAVEYLDRHYLVGNHLAVLVGGHKIRLLHANREEQTGSENATVRAENFGNNLRNAAGGKRVSTRKGAQSTHESKEHESDRVLLHVVVLVKVC